MNSILPGKKIRRIIHLADIHIRLFKRADEYRKVFHELYRQLAQLEVTQRDLIVVAGDIVHTKTDMSPEMMDLVQTFFALLTNHAPVVVIAGNHDFNMANMNRMDALTPIVKGMEEDGLHYLKHSGVTRVGDLDIATFSILDDPSDWPTADDCPAETKIALFHGPVYSACTDVGYTITNRHHVLDMFDGFDIVMLGDIHKHQVLQDYDPVAGKPIVVYPGSLIQQNHGELPKGHGICDWNVKDRSFKFHEVENEFGFYTIRIDGKKLPNTSDMPKNVRLRIFTGDLDETEIKKYVTTLRLNHNIVECSITRPNGINRKQDTAAIVLQDVNDVGYQNSLISDWIRTHVVGATDALVDKAVDINQKLNSDIAKDDLARKLVWIPKRLKFDNLFTYGEGSEINFDSLQGIVGVFAPNTHGKSSIPDAICLALFDRTPRTTLTANFMNTRRNDCYLEFTFMIGAVEYGIIRRGKRNKAGDVKLDVEFWYVDAHGEKVSLNGEKRQATNAVIRQYVGDFDDFLLTAFSVQDKNSLFIDRGQSDRKDVLNQFMGLRIFESLFEEGKEQSKSVAAVLRQFKQDDFTDQLAITQTELTTKMEEQERLDALLLGCTTDLDNIDVELQAVYSKRIPVLTLERSEPQILSAIERAHASIGDSIIYRDQLRAQISGSTAPDTSELDHTIEELESKIVRGHEVVAQNVAWIAENEPRVAAEMRALKNAMVEDRNNAMSKKSCEQTIEAHRAKLAVLAKHKFDPNCDFCVNNEFVKDARTTQDKLDAELVRLAEFVAVAEDIAARVYALPDSEAEWTKVVEMKELITKQQLKLSQFETRVQGIRRETQQLLVEAERKVQRAKDALIESERSDRDALETITKMEEMLKQHEAQADAVAFNDTLLDEIVRIKARKQQLSADRGGIERTIQGCTSAIAVLRSKRQTMLDKIKLAEEKETEHKAYTAYLEAVGRDGVPYQLVSEIIPQVETEINNILSQMVEFGLVLDVDGKNINARIVYDEERVWPLELASGMEKFITGLAIRVALMGVSSLPKSNFLIIDEGFGALDPEIHNSLSMLMSMLKTQFEFVLLISHMESLRDVTDMLVDIDRSEGFSRIKVA